MGVEVGRADKRGEGSGHRRDVRCTYNLDDLPAHNVLNQPNGLGQRVLNLTKHEHL
jgi:hypothetical protein